MRSGLTDQALRGQVALSCPTILDALRSRPSTASTPGRVHGRRLVDSRHGGPLHAGSVPGDDGPTLAEDYASDAGARGARARRRRPRDVVGERPPSTATTCRACCPSSRCSASTRSTTASPRRATPDDVDGLPLPPHPRPGPGQPVRDADDRAVARADQPDGRRQDAQALRDWGDFVHIRHIAAGRRTRVHDDHAVRERRRAVTRGTCTSTRWTPTNPSSRSSR